MGQSNHSSRSFEEMAIAETRAIEKKEKEVKEVEGKELSSKELIAEMQVLLTKLGKIVDNSK